MAKVATELTEGLRVEPELDVVALACATRGRPLGGDPEDEPAGDADLPICGECNRERNFAAIGEVEGCSSFMVDAASLIDAPTQAPRSRPR